MTKAPSACAIVIWQLRTARPSMSTVHAPQSPVPQPYLVPVRFDASRIAHNNGVDGSIRYRMGWLLTVRLVTPARVDLVHATYHCVEFGTPRATGDLRLADIALMDRDNLGWNMDR